MHICKGSRRKYGCAATGALPHFLDRPAPLLSEQGSRGEYGRPATRSKQRNR